MTARSAGNVLRLSAGAVATLATGEARPGRVKVETGGEYVYWVAEGSGVADGAVRRAPVAGGPAEDVAAGLDGPRGLALGGGRAYWADPTARVVGFAPLAGGATTTIADAEGYPSDVLADETTGEVFWTSPGRRGGGWLHRTGLELGGDTLVSFSPPGPAWLARDGAYIIWSTAQTLTRAEAAGSAYEDLAVEVAVCDFVLAGRAAYWTDASTGRVLAWPLP